MSKRIVNLIISQRNCYTFILRHSEASMNYRDFTNVEIATIVSYSVTYDCEKARRMFEDNFNKQPPPARTLRDWKTRFLETLSIAPRPSISKQSDKRISDEKREEILAAFETDPCSSQRKVAQETGTSQSSICRVLKEESVKPWKFTSVQELLVDDPPKRVGFCRLMLDRLSADSDFVRKICFSDEATFHLNGCVNKHNRFVYAKENPHLFIEDKMLRSPAITCWAMVSPDLGVTFKLLDSTMNSERYHDILQTIVFPILTQRRNRTKVYQQDGAPPHFATIVRNSLDCYLNNRWIGRGGPIMWPPRSPDLSVPDFWLWGQIRDSLYKAPRPKSLQDLKSRLIHLLESMDKATIQKAYQSFVRRCELCVKQDGGHFEQLL